MANSENKNDREMESYVDADKETQSVQVTMGTTPAVTKINIPDTAKGFRLYPRVNDIRFSVNETVTAVQSSSAATVTTSLFGQGGIAKAEMWETRLLMSGVGRFLTLISATSSTVVEVEIF